MWINKIVSYTGKKILPKITKKGTTQTVQAATKPLHKTKVLTDPLTGKVVGMEREITTGTKETGYREALARVEYMSDGSRKLTITGVGDEPFSPTWRTTKVTREKGAGIFGGDKVTIDKDTTKYWAYSEKAKLTKEYSKNGLLQHKELSFSHDSGNGLNDYTRKATQDLVNPENKLTSGIQDMLTEPSKTDGVMHSLTRGEYRTSNNYYKFADSTTNYEKAIEAKKQAAIDAAKKAEAEKIAAKEAAEKAAAELAAKIPRINVSKVTGRNIEELTVKEKTRANGTIERVFSDPETGEKLITTRDNGLLHQEWITGSKKADMIYMKQVGKDEPYIVSRNGKYTQVSEINEVKYGGHKYNTRNHTQYYNDNDGTYLKRDIYGGGQTGYSNGRIKLAPDKRRVVYQGSVNGGGYSYYSRDDRIADAEVKRLDEEAKKSFVDLKDLFSDYKSVS